MKLKIENKKLTNYLLHIKLKCSKEVKKYIKIVKINK